MLRKAYAPSAAEVVVAWWAVPVLSAVTVAPGTPAPWASRTVPTMEP